MYKALLVENTNFNLNVLKDNPPEFTMNWMRAKCPNEALHILEKTPDFDVLVLDVPSEESKCLELLEQLKMSSRYSDLMIFLRGSSNDLNTKLNAFRLGVDDYFPEAMSPDEVSCRIESRLIKHHRARGNFMYDDEILLESHLQRASLKVEGEYRDMHLTAKEFKILSLFVQHPGRSYSREDICRLIWGRDINISTRTINSHIFGLRKKMGGAGDRIESLPGFGYRFRAGNPSTPRVSNL